MSTLRTAAVVAILISGFCAVTQQQDDEERVEMNCDPRVQHRFSVCPEGYCCVRDEFWPSWVYCRKMGLVHQDCTTRDTETNCPCGPGLFCKPNIRDSHSGVASLYGRCVNDSSETTTTAGTTTTPTSTSITTTTTTIVTTTPTPTVTVEPLQQSTPCAHGHSCEEHGPLTPASQTHGPDEQPPKEDHAEGGRSWADCPPSPL